MSILRAIERAYRVAAERKWDRVYWALDLHGTCIESNYKSGDIKWINAECGPIIKSLSDFSESRIIIWSSMYPTDKRLAENFFLDQGIKLFGSNNNPYEGNTQTGCFDEKFYMSIIVDDKAGFDPSEWPDVLAKVIECREKYGIK